MRPGQSSEARGRRMATKGRPRPASTEAVETWARPAERTRTGRGTFSQTKARKGPTGVSQGLWNGRPMRSSSICKRPFGPRKRISA